MCCCDIMLDHGTANIMLLSVRASPCDGEGCEGLVTYYLVFPDDATTMPLILRTEVLSNVPLDSSET